MSYSRFAVYFVPPSGALYDFGATWLGWDIGAGVHVVQPDVPGLHDITMTPRKYGFHGTLKPPFRLASGAGEDTLMSAVADLASRTAPATLDKLRLTTLGKFLALTPKGDTTALQTVAEVCVTHLDTFRAPATEADLARRRQAGLTPRQDALLVQWGYPYVLEEFRFHLTLSGRLTSEDTAKWHETAATLLPVLPEPFVVDEIALCGERPDGCFEVIDRYPLTG